MNLHFPILIPILLLTTAVLIPIIKKRIQKLILVLLGIYGIFSLLTCFYVFENGAFAYHFGGWDQKIGIQFIINEFSAVMTFFILSISFLVAWYSLKNLEQEIGSEQVSSYYTLFFLLLFSMTAIVSSNDLFNIYIFIEILSLASCGIVSIKKKKENYLAAFRYLMLNAIGSLAILLGIAFLYMVTGNLNITEVSFVICKVWEIYPKNIIVALSFILTGLGIKAAIFPMHIWLPDAHASAPTCSSVLLSCLVIKVYVFCATKILFQAIGKNIVISLGIPTFIVYISALSMIMGSIFAIGQRDVKRILAYSSIAQMGYICLGLGLATENGLSASFFHIISHALLKAALFLSVGSIIYLHGKRNVEDFAGMAYQMPVSMCIFTIGAFGLIGLPGTNGFMSKLYLSLAAIEEKKYILLAFIIGSSFLNAMYYLPIIFSSCKESQEKNPKIILDPIPISMMIPMILVAATCLFLGFYPQIAMGMMKKIVAAFMIGV